jgi:hypothetical protein
MALHFTWTEAPLAAKCMQILQMTQYADNIWNEGKFLHLFTDHKRSWKHCPSTHKYLLQLIVSLKNRCTTILLALTAHQTPTFSGWLRQLCCCSHTGRWVDTPFSWATPMSSNFSSVSTRRQCFFPCLLRVPHCSKFIHQIMNSLSAGNSVTTEFISKFSPTLSSRSVYHVGVIQKNTLL